MCCPPKFDNDIGAQENFFMDDFAVLKPNSAIYKRITVETEKYDDQVLGIGLSRSLIKTTSLKINLNTSIVTYPESKLIIQSIFATIINHWNENSFI